MTDHNAFILFMFILLHSDRDGVCRVSRYTTSSILGMKPSTYRNALARLADNRHFGGHVLDTSGGKKYTLVSVVNWDKYQSPTETPKTVRGQRKDTLTRIENKEVTTYNKTEETLLKFLKSQPQIKNAESYLVWLKKEVPPKKLEKLLTIDIHQWTEYINLWKVNTK